MKMLDPTLRLLTDVEETQTKVEEPVEQYVKRETDYITIDA